MLLILFIQSSNKKYSHPRPYAFILPTIINGNDATTVASVAVAVAIVNLPAIQNIWDDTVNIVNGNFEVGIPTWQFCWCGTTYLYLNFVKTLTNVSKVYNSSSHVSACTAKIPELHIKRYR